MPFTAATPYTLNFTGFTGAGFSPSPGVGQLNSNEFRIVGFSDPGGDSYGATLTTSNTDYARGTITGVADPTTAGVYAAITGDPALGTSFVIQPTAGEFGTAPGTITLRVQYTGTVATDGFSFSYTGVYRNNSDRSVSVAVGYAVQAAATEPATFTAAPSLGFASPTTNVGGNAAPWTPVNSSTLAVPGTISPNSYVFVRFTIGDNTANPGSGNRDEVGFDNIVVSALDLTAPVSPSRPLLASASDTGLAGDNVTSVALPTLTGTAEPGSTVRLIDGAAVIGTGVANGTTGAWTITPTTALTEGFNSLTATATDASGNVSLASTALSVRLDTIAPPVPSTPVLALASDSGTAGDNITRVTLPTLTGTAEAGSTVRLFDAATLIGTGTAAAVTGAWSITATTALTEGVNTLTATATDLAGNVSLSSAVLQVRLDTAVPAAPGAPALAPASDSGTAGDGITNVALPTLTGLTEPGSTVRLLDGAVLIGTATANGTSGAWSITASTALTEGANSLTATATDAAGNVSVASAATSLRLDRLAPAAPGRPVLAPESDSGIPGDGITNVSTPTLTGTAEAGSAVTVTDNASGAAVVLGTAVADASGAWRFTPGTLADGPHAFAATATDAAGNGSGASGLLAVTIDTTDYVLVDGLGVRSTGRLAPYQGGVPGVARQFVYLGAGGAQIVARANDAYLAGGRGSDAIIAQGGRNVIDGGSGSDFLTGGAGQDSFVIDARGNSWSTIAGFDPGDDITIRGVGGSMSRFSWQGIDGAAGSTGATLRGTLDGGATTFSVTFAGRTVEALTRDNAFVDTDASAVSSLHITAGNPASDPAGTFLLTTASGASVQALDRYSGPIGFLRYAHVQTNDDPVSLTSFSSDCLLQSGAGSDAIVVRNGRNVLDGGGGSNWFVGGAGTDTFMATVSPGLPVWDTVLNFHSSDAVMLRGYVEGISTWAWSAAAEGASGYTGATLHGASNGRDEDFSLTLAGVTAEQGRSLSVSPGIDAGGQGYLQIKST